MDIFEKFNSEFLEEDKANINTELKKYKYVSPNRGYIGVSDIAGVCTSCIYETVSNKKDKEFTYDKELMFHLGHELESKAIEILGKVGIKISDTQKEVRLNDLVGHMDGIVYDVGDSDLNTPCIWECKSMNDSNFNAIYSNGINYRHSHYTAQICLYQMLSGMTANPAILTCISRNTCNMESYSVPYNEKVAHAQLEKLSFVMNNINNPHVVHGATVVPCHRCEYNN